MSTVTAAWNVYNEEMFLGFSMLSLREIVDEFIVVDHGSNDDTAMIIKYVEGVLDKKVNHIYVDRKNISEPQTKNMKIKLSTCDWIVCMDGDEVYTEADAFLIKSWISKAEAEKKGGIYVTGREFVEMKKVATKFRKLRPRIFKNEGKVEYIGEWGADKVYSNSKFHMEDESYWMKSDIYFNHYSRLKHSVEQRKEKLYKYLSARMSLSKDDIYSRYIDNKDSKYYNEARNKINTVSYVDTVPEVFKKERGIWELIGKKAPIM